MAEKLATIIVFYLHNIFEMRSLNLATLAALVLVALSLLCLYRADGPSVLSVRASDGSLQKSLFWIPKSDGPVPLVIALHTWSGSYSQDYSKHYLELSKELGWAFLHPDFRGANDNPESGGSAKAIADVMMAKDAILSRAMIDVNRIYLIGYSGGGHMALLLAGQYRDQWAGVSVWSPITDLVRWSEETRDSGQVEYYEQIKKVCSGDPNVRLQARSNCKSRSPITYLEPDSSVPIAFYSGIQDGHTGSVPVSHSLLAYNSLVSASERIEIEDIRHIVETATPPIHPTEDREIDGRKVVYERRSGKISVTLFEGSHEILYKHAFEWLSSLREE